MKSLISRTFTLHLHCCRGSIWKVVYWQCRTGFLPSRALSPYTCKGAAWRMTHSCRCRICPTLSVSSYRRYMTGRYCTSIPEGLRSSADSQWTIFRSWEAWRWRKESCLSLLSWLSKRCKLLQNVPLGIKNLTKLKLLEFFNVHDELIWKLKQGDKCEDFRKVAHLPEIRYGSWTDGGWDVESVERTDETAGCPHWSRGEFPPCWNWLYVISLN